MTEKRRIVINTLVNGAAQFAAIVFALVLMPLLIRSFGLQNYGIYVIVASVGAYTTLLDLGVGAAVVKLTAEHAGLGRRDEVADLYATALAFYFAVGAVIAVLLVGVGLGAGRIFNVAPDGAVLLRNLLFTTAGASLFAWPLNASMYVLQGFQRYPLVARTSVMVLVCNAAVALVVIYGSLGPQVLLAAQWAVSLAGGALNTFIALRLIGRRVGLSRANRATFRSIAGFSWVVFVLQVCTIIIYEQTDRLILGVFVGAASVALYEAAGKFQQLVIQLTAFSNSAVIPAASHLSSRGDEDSLQALFVRGTRYSLALVLPIVASLLVLAKPIILAWLGPTFVDQAICAQLLLVHQLLTPGTAVGDNIVVGRGRARPRLPYVVGILTVGNLVIALALVGRLGILAVVLGTLIPHLIDFPFHARFLMREMRVPLRRVMKEIVLPLYPALVVPVAVSVAFRMTPLSTNLAGIALAGAAAVAAYWATLLRFGLSEAERLEVRAMLEALRARFRASPD